MKKNDIKKLQLSRETLLDLKNPEVQKAVRGGGGEFSNESYTCVTSQNIILGGC